MSISELDSKIQKAENIIQKTQRIKADLELKRVAQAIDAESEKTNRCWLEMIRLAGKWNGFDGDHIVSSLVSNNDLWSAIAFYPSGYSFKDVSTSSYIETIDLGELFSVEDDGVWRSDTLWILARPGKEAELERFGWDDLYGDEVSWADKRILDHSSKAAASRILRVWWD